MPTSKGPVLVVDDDSDILEALRDVLEFEGYRMIGAANGQDALDYLRTSPSPSLILLDWNMAPVNGEQFMEEVARDPAISRIPVVLLTADPRVPEKLKAAFVGYLNKPVGLDALFEIVGRYCA
jgi:CheY-like chemotaxis protein